MREEARIHAEKSGSAQRNLSRDGFDATKLFDESGLTNILSCISTDFGSTSVLLSSQNGNMQKSEPEGPATTTSDSAGPSQGGTLESIVETGESPEEP